jgi:cobalamin biosynthesis protein CbiG
MRGSLAALVRQAIIAVAGAGLMILALAQNNDGGQRVASSVEAPIATRTIVTALAETPKVPLVEIVAAQAAAPPPRVAVAPATQVALNTIKPVRRRHEVTASLKPELVSLTTPTPTAVIAVDQPPTLTDRLLAPVGRLRNGVAGIISWL